MSLSERLRELQPKPAKVLVLDIETSPAQAFVWGLRDQNISPGQVIEHSRVLCFAAKWMGSASVDFYSERDGREQMIEAAWSLLDEADVCVGYNHVRFDIPHLQREMVQAGYGPPSPWIDVDLLPAIRRRFRFMSNKLGSVTEQLGLDTKADPGGFDTWRGVLAGDDKAWRRMRHYNRMDVSVTADLYEYLKPWLRLPHAGLFSGDMKACAACGSTRLTPDGIARTNVAAWLRLACEDCNAHNRLLTNGETRLA
jgi:DNA polymerase elongation subunit (family B)